MHKEHLRARMAMISKRSLLITIVAMPITPIARDSIRRANAQTSFRNGMEANTVKIYMASPLGFSEAGRSFYNGTLIAEVTRLGYEVVDPWKLTDQAKIDAVQKMPCGPARHDAWQKLNAEIGGNNRTGINESDLVFAVLDGVDVDSGTASEIGYAFAKGKPILGYRGDFRLSGDNEGAIVNLQVEYFIRESGGDIITRLAELAPALAKIEATRTKN
jgi:nucleoside 2-deoxyribosyltransferase